MYLGFRVHLWFMVHELRVQEMIQHIRVQEAGPGMVSWRERAASLGWTQGLILRVCGWWFTVLGCIQGVFGVPGGGTWHGVVVGEGSEFGMEAGQQKSETPGCGV